ncbi:MAG: hypothetical protein V3V62_04875 [bacterium]
MNPSSPRRNLTARLLLAGALLLPAPAYTLVRGAALFSAAAAVMLAAPAPAEAARFGGMRGFGFRGSRGFSRRSFGRSAFGRGSRRSGFGGLGMGMGLGMGLGMGMGMGYGGFGFGLGRMLLFPLILLFVLRLMRGRRQ